MNEQLFIDASIAATGLIIIFLGALIVIEKFVLP